MRKPHPAMDSESVESHCRDNGIVDAIIGNHVNRIVFDKLCGQ
jgi:hypothetical protein